MFTESLISYNREVAQQFETLDKVNAYIVEVLGRYEDLGEVAKAADWTAQQTISKTISEALDVLGYKTDSKDAKAERTEITRRILAVFKLEKLHQLIALVLHHRGYELRVTGSTKVGDYGAKFVAPDGLRKTKDTVNKVAVGMAKDKKAADAIIAKDAEIVALQAKVREYELLKNGEVVVQK